MALISFLAALVVALPLTSEAFAGDGFIVRTDNDTGQILALQGDGETRMAIFVQNEDGKFVKGLCFADKDQLVLVNIACGHPLRAYNGTNVAGETTCKDVKVAPICIGKKPKSAQVSQAND